MRNVAVLFDFNLKIHEEITKNVEIKSSNTLRGSISHIGLRKHHTNGLYLNYPIRLEGVARVGGRLPQLDIDVETKHPIITPQRCYLTELVIRQHHNKPGHAGTSHT